MLIRRAALFEWVFKGDDGTARGSGDVQRDETDMSRFLLSQGFVSLASFDGDSCVSIKLVYSWFSGMVTY